MTTNNEDCKHEACEKCNLCPDCIKEKRLADLDELWNWNNEQKIISFSLKEWIAQKRKQIEDGE